jgi:hypothetical protein
VGSGFELKAAMFAEQALYSLSHTSIFTHFLFGNILFFAIVCKKVTVSGKAE